ncbi:MAG: arabinan endo,5-alpha-L-arabinosidase [Sphingomonadales bacterium]|jgi:arabinan endo-1,5-alpha-L-arabinosidase|nr:arabinan endo,5-alpha-L-arabinosidase [Sphingomonadales bacterium]
MGRLTLLLLALIAAVGATAAKAPPPPTFVNPVLDADFPDPAVLRAPDGNYYAYATQTERHGRMINIQVARSRDLVRWEHLGEALPAKPGWAARTQDFWAPHVVRHGGLYYLYYSAKPDAALADKERGLCLAVATSRRPQGPFADSGRPLQCGAGFVNIDPMAYDDPATGKRLLYWGSGFEPIRVRELAPDRLSFAPQSKAIELVGPAKPGGGDAFPALVEGAWILRHGGYYYLLYSGDNCCGPNARYAVMAARSRSATGPFRTLADATGATSSIILEAKGKWLAPGHNSLIEDARGALWILYHAVDTNRPRTKPGDQINTRRVMLLDRVGWRGGWPRVEGPTSGPQPRPTVR